MQLSVDPDENDTVDESFTVNTFIDALGPINGNVLSDSIRACPFTSRTVFSENVIDELVIVIPFDLNVPPRNVIFSHEVKETASETVNDDVVANDTSELFTVNEPIVTVVPSNVNVLLVFMSTFPEIVNVVDEPNVITDSV